MHSLPKALACFLDAPALTQHHGVESGRGRPGVLSVLSLWAHEDA